MLCGYRQKTQLICTLGHLAFSAAFTQPQVCPELWHKAPGTVKLPEEHWNLALGRTLWSQKETKGWLAPDSITDRGPNAGCGGAPYDPLLCPPGIGLVEIALTPHFPGDRAGKTGHFWVNLLL